MYGQSNFRRNATTDICVVLSGHRKSDVVTLQWSGRVVFEIRPPAVREFCPASFVSTGCCLSSREPGCELADISPLLRS